jgi:threonine synthase
MTTFHYKCTECNKTYSSDEVRYLCPECGKKFTPGEPLRGVLEVIFNYDYIKQHFDKNKPDWSLFSAVEPQYYPEYKVGDTPFVKVSRLAQELGYPNLWLKNDGLNPSGSLKDRASFLVVAEAIRLGEEKIVTASTGNAASALAAVCAAAGKKAIIYVPAKAPIAKLVQMLKYGAKVISVKGTYDDAFKLSLEYTANNDGLNRNTAYHPLTIEGKKTAGLEIFAQNNFKIPDAILIPVGDGVIISGVYKAFYDLKMAGLIDKLPKLICVQAETSNAIHNFIMTGKYHNATNPTTIADSISVSAPSNAYMAKKAVIESHGFSITVTDDEILQGQTFLANTTGIFAEPAAAATVAGLQKIAQQDLLPKNDQIVLLITGHGLKDINAAMKNITITQ